MTKTETCTSGTSVHVALCIVFIFHRYVFSIRVPHSETALGFRGDHAGAHVSFLIRQSYHAFSSQWNCTDFSGKFTGEYGHLLAAEPARAAAGRKYSANLDNGDYDDAYDDYDDNDHAHDRDNYDNRSADHSRRCLR